MDTAYYINLAEYSLEHFMKEIASSRLIPSRRILQDKVTERFTLLSGEGIGTLADVLKILKNPDAITAFAEKTGLPDNFLTILRREVQSLRPKPVRLKDFPGVPLKAIDTLHALDIDSTLQYFERARTAEERRALGGESGIGEDVLLDLARLTDLSRVKWIGPVFARLFVDAGFVSADALSRSSAAEAFEKLAALNNEKQYTKGKFTECDVALCIAIAKKVPRSMQF